MLRLLPQILSQDSLGKVMTRKRDKQPPKTKKYFRSTKSGAGMTKAGVARYRRDNPGSKLKTAVTGKVKKGSKDAKRRKSFCARSAGQMKKFPKAAKDPNSRLRQARRRWKCQMTPEEVLAKVESHEAECALRYKRIEERLDDQKAHLKNLDTRLWGIAILIVTIAGLEKFI